MSGVGKRKPTAEEVLGPFWQTREIAAEYVGLSTTTFDKIIRPLLTPDQVKKGKSKRLWFFVPAVVKAAIGRAKSAAGESESKESSSLERWRATRADREALDLARAAGKLIDVDEWREMSRAMFDAIKRFGETLHRQHGRDAAILFNEFLEELNSVDAGIQGNKGNAPKAAVGRA